MMRAKRVFLIVLDSLGSGNAPDASDFGDEGAFTLKSLYQTNRLEIPNLLRLGLGNIEGLDFLGKIAKPAASIARLREASLGKDTTIGHWELAGHISNAPLPTFPNGFPSEFLNAFSAAVGRGVLCNRPYSGTAVISDFGEEHIRTGKLIVYTSADSVFQVAAHTDVVPLSELYSICEKAREMLTGKLGVGRVIARPFVGSAPDFRRTADRRDFSLQPPCVLLPEAIANAGFSSISIGKIFDIFAGKKFTQTIRTHSNDEGMEQTMKIANTDFEGLCFVNLVDFDMIWGHRRDAVGYAEGLSCFDAWLGRFLDSMRSDDVLMITADHGCDPCFTKTTDHTRETVPLIVHGNGFAPTNLGTRPSFADVGATVASLLGLSFACDGTPLTLVSKN